MREMGSSRQRRRITGGGLSSENLSMEDVRSFIVTHDLPLINKTSFCVCFLSEKTTLSESQTQLFVGEQIKRDFLAIIKK